MMKKVSINYIKLDSNSIHDGVLSIGDKVTVAREIFSKDGKHKISPGDQYEVVGFLPENYAGGFIIDYNGQQWGFWFEGGMADHFMKVSESKQDSLEQNYGEIPYKILKVLHFNNFLTIKELIEMLFEEELSVSPENTKKVKNDIISAVQELKNQGMIGITRITKKDQKTYIITEKGRTFFNSNE